MHNEIFSLLLSPFRCTIIHLQYRAKLLVYVLCMCNYFECSTTHMTIRTCWMKQTCPYPCSKTSTWVKANVQRRFPTSYMNSTKGIRNNLKISYIYKETN